MGLFKSKEERRIERDMKIRQGLRAIEKSIRQQEKFSEDFIKNAQHAKKIGDNNQYLFIRGALKKTAAVKKMLRPQRAHQSVLHEVVGGFGVARQCPRVAPQCRYRRLDIVVKRAHRFSSTCFAMINTGGL